MLTTLTRRNLPQFVATALFGLAVSGILAAIVYRAEQARSHSAFEQAAQQQVSSVEEHLRSALHDLVAADALFSSAGVVNRAQFDTFSAPLLKADPAIQALEWIPSVPGSQRRDYERMARADGFEDFRFTVMSPRGMLTEGTRDQYFPVYYVSPYKGNQQALGFDLASNPARRAALEAAAASGRLVASSRIVLVQARDAGYGFLAFNPVYPSGHATPGAAPLGFVLGVFKVPSLVRGRQGAGPTARGGVSLAVFDVTDHAAGAAGTVLYPKGFGARLGDVLAHDLIYRSSLDVGGRQWQFVAYRTPSSSALLEALGVFAATLLATALILALMRQTLIGRESDAAREVAQRADAAKSNFLANVSHEMRTPLNGVIGMLDLLLQASLPSAQARMAEVARRSAVNLLGIINDLLDFSKIEAGRVDIAVDPVDLRRLLEHKAENFGPVASKAGCTLTWTLDPALPRLIASDELRLRQVLNNLLSNAIKFSSGREQPGRVELSASGAYDPALGDTLEFKVSDNGIGMDQAAQERMFQPFEQAEPSTTRRFGGTGLGLAITRRLVELMGGSIQVSSRPGSGSTFTVKLPLRAWQGPPGTEASTLATPSRMLEQALPAKPAQPPASTQALEPAQPPEPAPGPAAAGGRRVLVAEDHPTNREVMRLQLAQFGVEADMAVDGAQALDMFRRGRYELVLSDLHMPKLDGFDLARALRALEASEGRPRCALLAVTAAAQEVDLRHALAAGMDAALTKPIRLDAMREALQRWLPAAPQAQAGDGVAPTPAIDPQVLRELVGDDAATLAALRADYAEDLRRDLPELRRALEASQAQAVAALAHRFKSASRSIGALALGALCEQIEAAAKGSDPAAMAALLPRLETAAKQVLRELEQDLPAGG